MDGHTGRNDWTRVIATTSDATGERGTAAGQTEREEQKENWRRADWQKDPFENARELAVFPQAHDSFEEALVCWTRSLALPTLSWDPSSIFNELFPSWTLPVRQRLPIWCIEMGLEETLLGCTSSPEMKAWMVVVQGIHDGCRNG